jgi:hypothetical protein
MQRKRAQGKHKCIEGILEEMELRRLKKWLTYLITKVL